MEIAAPSNQLVDIHMYVQGQQLHMLANAILMKTYAEDGLIFILEFRA